jgi:hypothetical protein
MISDFLFALKVAIKLEKFVYAIAKKIYFSGSGGKNV